MDKNTDYSSIGFMPGETRKNNVIYFLDQHAQNFPNQFALKWVPREMRKKEYISRQFPHRSIVYKDLAGRINKIAAGLKKHGIKKGDRIIIFVPLSVELYLSMFAVQRIGAVAVFLDSWARRDHLSVCANIVRPKAMVSLEKAFDFCQEIPGLMDIPIKIVVGPHKDKYTASLKGMISDEENCEVEPVKGEDTALITFTTGSSGIPKGANRTHRFLAAQHKALEKIIPYEESDIDLPVFPIFSLNNLAGKVMTVLSAIDLAFPSKEDAAIIVSQFFSESVTCCTVSPSIFINIAEYCRKNKIVLSGLKRVVTGGAPVSKDNVRNFKAIAPSAKIMVLYGSTEVEPISHIEANKMLKDKSTTEGVNVGEISSDLDYKIIKITKNSIKLDESGWGKREVDRGKIGELIVSGEHVCKSYYNNTEAFKKTKIQEKNGKIWHRTGDVGRVDDRQRLWLVGRVHNAIFRAGEYLFPVQAEILLKRLHFVKRAAFLGIGDEKLGQKAVAAISLKGDFNLDKQKKYRKEAENILRKNNIPVDKVQIVNQIPLDPRHQSKVEYSKLKKMIKCS